MIKDVLILVYNQNGDLALQLRSAEDDSYPLHWDFSAGGGVDNGETPEAAAIRELKEELGISASLTKIGSFFYKDVKNQDSSCLYPNAQAEDGAMVFRAQYDGTFSLNPKEVQEVRFVDSLTLKDMIAANEKFHPEFYHFLTKGIHS